MSHIAITIAVPAAHVADANQLARCLGLSEADARTFRAAGWQDGDGNTYAVASGLVRPSFSAGAASPLVEPAWGADMTAAARAQALLSVFDPEASPVPFAGPDRIGAVLAFDAQEALAILGLTAVPYDLEMTDASD